MTWTLRREKKLASMRRELRVAQSSGEYSRAVVQRLEKALASKIGECVMLRLKLEQQRRGQQ